MVIFTIYYFKNDVRMICKLFFHLKIETFRIIKTIKLRDQNTVFSEDSQVSSVRSSYND